MKGEPLLPDNTVSAMVAVLLEMPVSNTRPSRGGKIRSPRISDLYRMRRQESGLSFSKSIRKTLASMLQHSELWRKEMADDWKSFTDDIYEASDKQDTLHYLGCFFSVLLSRVLHGPLNTASAQQTISSSTVTNSFALCSL